MREPLISESCDISLRAVEPEDLDFLYMLENDPSNWEVSNTRAPYSRNTLQQYLESVKDIYSDKQLRLVILFNQSPAGLLDFFDFDPYHQRAGIGIVVTESSRQKGVGRGALQLAVEFARGQLGLRNLFCNILAKNEASIRLFEQCGFRLIGSKSSWHRTSHGEFVDELFYQYQIR